MFESKQFFVAGVQFHQLKKVIDDLSEGDTLMLIPDPENKYDPNAVEIRDFETETMIGFVPKKFSSDVAAALEIGTDIKCTITELNKPAKPWERIEVKITEVQGE